jgi:hypothetical protein
VTSAYHRGMRHAQRAGTHPPSSIGWDDCGCRQLSGSLVAMGLTRSHGSAGHAGVDAAVAAGLAGQRG